MVARFRKILIALRRRFAGKGERHSHERYTFISSMPEITVDGLKREQRREERLRGYGR